MFAKIREKRRAQQRADQVSMELALIELERAGLAVKRGDRYFLAPGVKIEAAEYR